MKFTRHAHHRKKKLSSSYRRPKGLQNKMRLAHKGTGPMVSLGYRSPADARGKKQGLELVHVHTLAEVDAVDVKTQGVIVGNVGMKKELSLLARIKEKKIKVFGLDIDARTKELQSRFDEKKKVTSKRRKDKEAKIAAEEKKAKKKDEKKDDKKLEDTVKDDKPKAAVKKASAKKAKDKEEKTEEEKQKDKVLTKAR